MSEILIWLVIMAGVVFSLLVIGIVLTLAWVGYQLLKAMVER